MSFRTFADDIKGLAEHLVRLVADDHDIVPMVSYQRGNHVDTIPVDAQWFAPELRHMLVENLIVPFIGTLRPESVAWTFTGRRGELEGFFDHEVACAVVIDRERAEVWEARLVRHDGGASIGAWRPWPIDAAGGLFVSPIQKALREC